MEGNFNDSAAINRYLKEIHSSNGAHTLSINLARSFLQLLHDKIINLPTNDKEKFNSITAMSNLIHFLPQTGAKSSQFIGIFDDYNFLNSIINCAISNPYDDAPYLIINSVLKGDMVPDEYNIKTLTNNVDRFKNLMNLIVKNLKIIENIPKRLQSKSKNLLPSSIEFIILLTMISSPLENINYALKILMVYCQINIPEIILNVFNRPQNNNNNEIFINFPISSKLLNNFNTYYIKSYGNILKNLNSIQINFFENQLHQTIINTLITNIKNFNHLNVGNSLDKYKDPSSLFEKLGFTSNPINYIITNYSLSIIFTVITFLIKPSINPFKLKCKQQYLLVTSENKRFPMNKMLFEISSLLNSHNDFNNNRNLEIYNKYILHYDQIFSLLLNKSLVYWNESKANNSNINDIKALLLLIKLDMKYIDSLIVQLKDFDRIVKKSLELSYSKIKNIQITYLRENQYISMMNSKDLKNFNETLIENLKFFIINQRFTELSNGCICYDDDPDSVDYSLSINSSKLKKRLYIALSPNKNFVLYKKLSEDLKLNKNDKLILDKSNSNTIHIRSIKRVLINDSSSSKQVFSSSSNIPISVQKRFVSMDTRNKTTKIQLFDSLNESQSPVFTFYIDDRHNALLWIDGLNLLIDNFKFTNVSQETKSHMKQLFDIKRSMQFSTLNDTYNMKEIDLPSIDENFKFEEKPSPINNDLIHYDFLIDQFNEIKFDNYNNLIKKEFEDYLLEHDNSSINTPIINKKKSNTTPSVIPEHEEEEDSDVFDFNYDQLRSVASGFYYI